MGEPITKRLHISGLTPSLTQKDLSQRFSAFGTVKAVDGLGLLDALGQPRKFGYVTLETTAEKLTKCFNLLSGTTWKGTKLRIGEAKPDFAERLAQERQAASDEPPKKKRKRCGGVYADDMSLVTRESVVGRGGWKVTPLGRIMRPVRMRPDHPLPPLGEDKTGKPKPRSKVRTMGGKDVVKREGKKKRARDPDVRARRKTIDMMRWGSVHLKGMFLDSVVVGEVGKQDSTERRVDEIRMEMASDDESDGHDKTVIEEQLLSSRAPVTIQRATPVPFQDSPPSEIDADVALEKDKSLNILASLFGGQQDVDWVGRESVGSDVDEQELMKGQGMPLEGDDDMDFEVVPMDTDDTVPVHAKEDNTHRHGTAVVEKDPVPPPAQKSQKLKDLFAPQEEDTGFSLLGHLDLDLELDEEAPFSTTHAPTSQEPVSYTPLSIAPVTQVYPHVQLNPKQTLFFPLPSNSGDVTKARPKDLFDVAKENGWNWRDPSVGFYRTGTDGDVRARWEAEKVELTREWKRRWREAGKVSKRRRGGAGDGDLGD